ncbi:spore germination protein GerPA/GerPF [Tumebacillus sp. BK434]|uniref:spore germination protein n=1 Tax=Tumebacillus sp. BK434 TaxID=2512169 RepID=UPI00104C9AFE|nr:spore germination protein [Tumebacillus sp. BK434]TCP53381.1 spore germination protein GerPA/GerPF [Tumebacillus sp. BK434]
MAFTINIFCIKVNNVENASALNVGQNLLNDWKNNSKYNQGFGNLNGDENVQKRLRSRVDDPDFIDAPVRDTSVTQLPSLLG